MPTVETRATVAVAGEDHAHRVLATRLLDLALLARAAGGWPAQDELDQARVWCELDPSNMDERCFYRTKHLFDDLSKAAGRPLVRARLMGDKPPGQAIWFIELYQLFALRDPPIEALIALSDSDSDSDAEVQAAACAAVAYIRENLSPRFALAFGVPHCDAEGWFVAALTDGEAPGRHAATSELSFDPIAEPHRLTAQPNHAVRDAKRVLRFLLGRGGKTLRATATGALGWEEYEALAGWTTTDLPRLTSHEACGLRPFIAELWQEVAPRIVPGPPPGPLP